MDMPVNLPDFVWQFPTATPVAQAGLVLIDHTFASDGADRKPQWPQVAITHRCDPEEWVGHRT
ncbi:MAG: hypothetical protein KDJ36_05615 [Hyphomicrobiaceae bacterium]|nr:hypothetical protein [Hyphomicrobiaceae bacterium]